MEHKQVDCGVCNKKVWNYKLDGCSHCECPHRKTLTAAPNGFRLGVSNCFVKPSPRVKGDVDDNN